MESDSPRESSSNHTKLILFCLIGITCLAVAVVGVTWVINRSIPQKRGQVMFEKFGGTRYTLAPQNQADGVDLAIAADVLRRRLEDLGAEYVSIEFDANQIVVSVPQPFALADTKVLTGAGELTFHMAHPDYQDYISSGNTPVVPNAELFPHWADPTNKLLIKTDPEIDGSEVKRAFASNQLGRWEIILALKSHGADQFYDLSRFHTVSGGTGLPFAIVLDGEILSAPVFNEPIPGGNARITGDFSESEAITITTLMMTPLPGELMILDADQIPPKG